MKILTNDSEEAKTAFREKFAKQIGSIAAVLQQIPLIDTGHDGAEFVLSEARERVVGNWEMSAMPNLESGHDGKWHVHISQVYDAGPSTYGSTCITLKQWTRLDIEFDVSGSLVSCELHKL